MGSTVQGRVRQTRNRIHAPPTAKEREEMKDADKKYVYCKYCGAKLRHDIVGQFCPTINCQWAQGLPAAEDTAPHKERKK
jgi:hypothetical protein